MMVNMTLFLTIWALTMAKYQYRKGAFWLFRKSGIFPEEIAGNGAILVLDFS
jgi:hypothetical protein